MLKEQGNILMNKVLTSCINDTSINFDKDITFNTLFEKNHQFMFDKINFKYANSFSVDRLYVFTSLTDKTTALALNKFYGKIHVSIDKNVSDSFMKYDITSVSMSDFENMPFECFSIELEHLDNVDSALVYKKDNKLYCHIQDIGQEKVSLQMIVDGDDFRQQHSISSFYYDNKIEHISDTTYEVFNKAFSYIMALLLYMTNFRNNEEMVVRTMNHDSYRSKLTDKQLGKHKIQKKLQAKKNLVTLKFASNNVKYENSTTRGKNKKCSTPFLVTGYYRNQRVGARDNYTIKTIWIKPFFKCEYKNNLDFIDRVYKVA